MKSSTITLLVILIGVASLVNGAIPKEKKDSKEDSSEKKDSKEDSSEKKDSKEKTDTEPLVCDYKEEDCVIHNENIQTVVHLNYLTYHIGFFNGATGEAFIFPVNNYKGVYITSKQTNLIWNSNNTKTYNSNTNLVQLYQIGETQGIQFDATTISSSLTKKLNRILKSQSLVYSSDCKTIGYALQITRQVEQNRMANFWKLFSPTRVQLRGDLNHLLTIFEGLQDFEVNFKPEGYKTFSDRNTRISFEEIISKDQSGFEVLQTFLTALSDRTLIVKYLGNLNNPSKFIESVSSLSGRVYYGYDGALNVINQNLRYLDGSISLKTLQYDLHLYAFNHKAVRINLEDQLRKDSERFYKFIKDELKMEKEFKDLLEFLKKLKDGKFSYKDVNVWEIIKILGTVPEKKEEVSEKVIKEVTKGKDSKEDDSKEDSKESREYKGSKPIKNKKARKNKLKHKLQS